MPCRISIYVGVYVLACLLQTEGTGVSGGLSVGTGPLPQVRHGDTSLPFSLFSQPTGIFSCLGATNTDKFFQNFP